MRSLLCSGCGKPERRPANIAAFLCTACIDRKYGYCKQCGLRASQHRTECVDGTGALLIDSLCREAPVDHAHNAEAAEVLRLCFDRGEHPAGKFYTVPKYHSAEPNERLLKWLAADAKQGRG